MKPFKISFISIVLLFSLSAPAFAGDFGWVKNFNIQARTNPTGFRTSLAARFDLGSTQTLTVIRSVDSPAAAYIMLRLGEISGKSERDVIKSYKRYKNKGWGRLARNLEIQPGSKEFHNLKQGHDLRVGRNHRRMLNFGPERALLLMLAQSVCKLETQNMTIR
jgi:hypothetical protein